MKKFSDIKLIQNNENIGMAARNIGVENSQADFIVFLDSDTIVENDWLKNLIESFKKHGEGLYQPKILEKENPSIISSSGNMINIFGFGYARERGKKDTDTVEKFSKIGYTSGACTFSSSKTIKKIGKIDEIFFAYHDDLDLGWRAALIGIKSYYVPQSIVYHHLDGYSFKWSKLKFFFMERNRKYCILTHYSRSTFYKMLPSLLLIEFAVFFFYLKKGMGFSFLKTIFDIIKNRKQIHKRYKEIQNFRLIDDDNIVKNFKNEIFVPGNISSKNTNKSFNLLLSFLSKIIRKLV